MKLQEKCSYNCCRFTGYILAVTCETQAWADGPHSDCRSRPLWALLEAIKTGTILASLFSNISIESKHLETCFGGMGDRTSDAIGGEL
jgi:hypothetical protein